MTPLPPRGPRRGTAWAALQRPSGAALASSLNQDRRPGKKKGLFFDKKGEKKNVDSAFPSQIQWYISVKCPDDCNCYIALFTAPTVHSSVHPTD